MLSLYEYEAKMYAFRLSQIDEEMKMHKQAWINHQVTAMKKQGDKQVPVFKEFKQFYDYEKAIKKVEGEFGGSHVSSVRLKNLANIAKKANERR